MLSSDPILRLTLPFQMLWAVLISASNIYGIAMINSGQAAPFPKSSTFGLVLFAAIAFALFDFLRRWPLAFTSTTAAVAFVSGGILFKLLIGDPAFWPTASWGYAALAVNLVGLVAALIALARIGQLRLAHGRPFGEEATGSR
ncbi:MAG: hypothetical protein ACK50Q_18990 [Labrys sp. (in: a-proteobacteria)]|jgi:hypothetical protein